LAHAPPVLSADAVAEEEFASPAVETAEYSVQSDPTIAHASLTEIDTETVTSLANGHNDKATETTLGVPQNSGIDEGAANAAADSRWDSNADLSASQEWVDVSPMRETSETDTGPTATLGAPSNSQGWAAPNTQSWADDQPEESPKPEVSLLTSYSCAFYSCGSHTQYLHRFLAAMMAFTKFIEPVAVEIVMDNSVDAQVVVEITVDIVVVAASEATTVVIGAAAAVVLEGADLLAPVDLTKRNLQQSGQNGSFTATKSSFCKVTW
jgi:hypothetical protein